MTSYLVCVICQDVTPHEFLDKTRRDEATVEKRWQCRVCGNIQGMTYRSPIERVEQDD